MTFPDHIPNRVEEIERHVGCRLERCQCLRRRKNHRQCGNCLVMKSRKEIEMYKVHPCIGFPYQLPLCVECARAYMVRIAPNDQESS